MRPEKLGKGRSFAAACGLAIALSIAWPAGSQAAPVAADVVQDAMPGWSVTTMWPSEGLPSAASVEALRPGLASAGGRAVSLDPAAVEFHAGDVAEDSPLTLDALDIATPEATFHDDVHTFSSMILNDARLSAGARTDPDLAANFPANFGPAGSGVFTVGPTPEPGTLGLLAIAALGALRRRR